MLDLGDFGLIVEKILRILPQNRCTHVYSATITSNLKSLYRASLSNPARITISTNQHQTISSLIQKYIFCPLKLKDLHLIHLLNDCAGRSIIIFIRTVNEAQRLAIFLRSLNFSAIPLHGQLSQSSRFGALNKFRSGPRNILVATDVAARGLDIPLVDLVVNFDLPHDSTTYIHRVGRTARAGKSGKAISIITRYDVEIWQRIEKALGEQLPEHKIEKDEIMVFGEQISIAQREAVRAMKDLHEGRGTKGATLRGRIDELDNMSEIGTYSTVVLPPNFQYLLPPDYPAISALPRYFYYIVSVIPVSRKSIKSIISELVHSSTVMRPVS